MQKSEEMIKLFHEIYETFPKSYNWQWFLTIKNWKRLFFNLFIKKYWLNWNKSKYKTKDILRRIRMMEFFDYITSIFDIIEEQKGKFIIETKFFIMIIIESKNKKLELLSFYNFR